MNYEIRNSSGWMTYLPIGLLACGIFATLPKSLVLKQFSQGTALTSRAAETGPRAATASRSGGAKGKHLLPVPHRTQVPRSDSAGWTARTARVPVGTRLLEDSDTRASQPLSEDSEAVQHSGGGNLDVAVTDAPPVPGAEATGMMNSFGSGATVDGTHGETASIRQKEILDLTSVDYQWNPPPIYPILGRERGWTGEVGLRVLVGPDGNAKEIRIASSSGHPALDESAVQAVRAWRFIPATQNSQPVPSWVRIPLVFQLEH